MVERRGAKLAGIAAGVLRLPAGQALELRLETVHRALGEAIEAYTPTVMAVEDIFYAEFPAAAIKLGHVRGVVLLVGAQRGLEVASYAPALVKRTLAGRGAAEKTQVARLVTATLGLRTVPPADAADALAVAITHCSKAQVP